MLFSYIYRKLETLKLLDLSCVLVYNILHRIRRKGKWLRLKKGVLGMEVSYERLATIFKALSDETRLHIIDMLSCNELCACDILASFNLSQSTLSYHMKF